VDVKFGVMLKRPKRFTPDRKVLPEERYHFLVSDRGEWHVAGPDFLPSAFGPVTTRALCGAQVEAIGSANYSEQPCAACLARCVPAIKGFYPKGRKAC